jgi:hypothetical protein
MKNSAFNHALEILKIKIHVLGINFGKFKIILKMIYTIFNMNGAKSHKNGHKISEGLILIIEKLKIILF